MYNLLTSCAEARETPGKGFGSFALTPIPRGTFVVCFGGLPLKSGKLGVQTLAPGGAAFADATSVTATTLGLGAGMDSLNRIVVFGGIALYTLASIGCALAPSFGTLLAFRAMQGMTAGVGVTIAAITKIRTIAASSTATDPVLRTA